MKTYIERESISNLIDTHLSQSCGAEHYAYGVLKSELKDIPDSAVREIIYAEWKMVLDDFEDGAGEIKLPHCSKCYRGVYRHDAGSWCPFCGAAMKNPMR